jgi:flagellar L-ring protein precursor FlgH
MIRPLACLFAAAVASPALADDLYSHDNWASLASDRNADRAGDILTVLIFENAVATNSAQNGSAKQTRLEGDISAGSAFNESGALGFGGRFSGTGQTGRAGKMVAQLSVTVERVLPNGDLVVAGGQELKINGERTHIKLRGRVRRADIANNAVLSTRIADAAIDYDGTGFVSRSAKPGIINRIFNWLGIL